MNGTGFGPVPLNQKPNASGLSLGFGGFYAVEGYR